MKVIYAKVPLSETFGYATGLRSLTEVEEHLVWNLVITKKFLQIFSEIIEVKENSRILKILKIVDKENKVIILRTKNLYRFKICC